MTFKLVDLVLYFCLLWVSVAQNAGKLPNLDYLAAGYNVIFGNPHVWDGEMDPGFAVQKIYNFTYSGEETSDGKYLLPDYVDELSCVTDCTIDTIYYDYTGIERYSQTLSEEALLSGSMLDVVKFSGSADYQTVQKSTEVDHHVFTSIYAKCCAYAAAIDQFTPPNLSSNFIAAVKEMPLNFNTSDSYIFFYNEFIPAFGTHALIQVEMGSRFGEVSNFERYQYSSYSSSNLDIYASAQASMLVSAGCVSSMTNYTVKEATYFSQVTDYQKTFFVGANIPTSQSGEQWLNNSKNTPNAITYQLQPLPNLLVPLYFPDMNRRELRAKQQALIDAYDQYCAVLLEQGQVQSCEAPPPDPPLPPSSIFGGMYAYPQEEKTKYQMPNPFTDGFNCPDGFESYIYGYLGTDGSGNVTLYLCLNETIMFSGDPGNIKDPMNFFGGAFESISSNVYQTNPMTSSTACGDKLTQYQLSYARVDGKDGSLYWCGNTTGKDPNGNSILGGFYQTCEPPPGSKSSSDCEYVTNNYYTKALSCPVDFDAYPIAYGELHDDNDHEGTIYACLSNIYDMN